MNTYGLIRKSENWDIDMPKVVDRGVNHKVDQVVESPVSITDDKDKCITYASIYKNRNLDRKHQDFDFTTQLEQEDEMKCRHIILGGFYLNSVTKYGGYMRIDADYRKNLPERESVVFSMRCSDYINGNILAYFKKAGILRINSELSKQKVEAYLQELLRIKVVDKGDIPINRGFNIWNSQVVFSSAEFYEANDLPVVIERRCLLWIKSLRRATSLIALSLPK